MFCRTLHDKHVSNSSGSFKRDRQETGGTEVHVSSLDVGLSFLFTLSSWRAPKDD